MKYMEDEKKGRCLECGDILPYGRSDMKFCSQSCRSRWHYVNDGRLQGLRRRTIGALDRNHKILESLLEDGITRISLPDLAQMGYKFDCITSYHKVGNRNEYRCFDIKYYMSESSVFRIERCQRPTPRLSPSGDP